MNKYHYHLFMDNEYYPRGGMCDYLQSFERLANAEAIAQSFGWDTQDFDTATIAITAENGALEVIRKFYKPNPLLLTEEDEQNVEKFNQKAAKNFPEFNV